MPVGVYETAHRLAVYIYFAIVLKFCADFAPIVLPCVKFFCGIIRCARYPCGCIMWQGYERLLCCLQYIQIWRGVFFFAVQCPYRLYQIGQYLTIRACGQVKRIRFDDAIDQLVAVLPSFSVIFRKAIGLI